MSIVNDPFHPDVPGPIPRTSIAWLLGLTVAACSGQPAQPTPPPTPNAPPVIVGIAASADRVEVTDEVSFAATVTDLETPLAQLVYEWSADHGTITGTGPAARWRPPVGLATPAQYRVRLTVVERYQTPPAGEHRVSADSPVVHVYDSPRELSDLALTFLREFADSSLSAAYCVRNFSDNCIGKAEEFGDIERNRAAYVNLAHELGTPVVSINPERTRADVLVSCRFLAQHRVTGVEGWAIGNCALTAVRENYRWWLCDSRFNPLTTFDRRFGF